MDVTLSPLDTSVESIGSLLGLIGLLFIPIEFVWLPARKQITRRGLKEMGASYGTAVLFILTQGVSLAVAYVGLSAVEFLVPWTFTMNSMLFIVVVIGAEFFYYWNHRLAHEVRALWATHSVHHSSPDFTLAVSVRILFLDAFYEWIFFVPLVLLGFPVLGVLLGWGVVIAYQGWIHTEMVPKLGVLEGFFNTPSNHRVHHGSDDVYLDKNYGGITVFFDRIFGTYQRELQRPVYGLTKQIGTANPVKVQLHEIRALTADLRAADSRTTKWKHLARGPGWQPQQVAGSSHSGELL